MYVNFMTKEQRAAQESQKKADAERQILDDNPELYIKRHTIDGHAFESHVANSKRSLLNNVLSGQKYGDTVFKNAETQTYCMQEILYNHMQDIHDWVKTAAPGQKTLYASDFWDIDNDKPDFIGEGFVSDAPDKISLGIAGTGVNYIQSNIAAVVIKKNPDAPDGWEITTAFPMSYPSRDLISDETYVVKPPNADFSKLLQQTRTYQNASPAKKIYMNAKMASNKTYPGKTITYMPQQDCVTIRDEKRRNLPGIRIKSDLGLALASYGRPDVDLNSTEKLKMAEKTVPDLLKQARELIQVSQSEREPKRPNLAQRDLSGLDVKQDSPQTSCDYNY